MTAAVRIFLGLSALVWLPYGIYCFAQPGYLEGAAGVAALTATGSVELRAMYGGLQVAIGALALGGALGEALRRPALVALAFLCAGLFLARAVAALGAGAPSGYTAFALGFELVSAALAAALAARTPRAA